MIRTMNIVIRCTTSVSVLYCGSESSVVVHILMVCVCLRDEEAPAKIPDEDAVKPDGWLDEEPEYISDPEALKPEDW